MPKRLLPRVALALLVAAVAPAVLSVASCAKKEEAPAPEPKVAPPVIGEAGVLRAGVDLSYPPFGAEVDGTKVGLDVDVAAALAERLGLKLEIVQAGRDEVVAALSEKRIDVALGALPLSEELLTDVTFAGSYIDDAPVFFAATEATITMTSLGKKRPGVQKESAAYWVLERELGSEIASGYPSLRAAFEALEAGRIEIVAGDAVVGGYLARDFGKIRFAGQIEPATPLGVAVAKDATGLESAVRDALDSLAADGVLEAIRTKWVGDLPELRVDTGEEV